MLHATALTFVVELDGEVRDAVVLGDLSYPLFEGDEALSLGGYLAAVNEV